MGNVTSYRVTGLQPFTVYVYKLSVCTAVGCSNSSNSAPQMTRESGKRLLEHVNVIEGADIRMP